jgi:4-hydroxy-3-methylbut-2-enyl diphosphate reductase
MEVRLADHYGMCFGVADAVELALRLTRQGPLTILGDLVHNPDVVADLDAAGAVRTRQPEAVQTRAVLLTAHGTANHVKQRLRGEGRQLHDAVCPLVKRAHQAAHRLMAEDRHLVVIGKAGHVEVQGLVGDLDDYTILLDVSEIDCLEGKPRLGIVAQTTQPFDQVQELVEAIRRRFPGADVRFIDTVCQPTKDRQDSLKKLAEECDVVVVVGGPESNNSHKLVELAERLGRPAYRVASAAELRPEWFSAVERVGLTAGTSTPREAIDAVRTWLESFSLSSNRLASRAALAAG